MTDDQDRRGLFDIWHSETQRTFRLAEAFCFRIVHIVLWVLDHVKGESD